MSSDKLSPMATTSYNEMCKALIPSSLAQVVGDAQCSLTDDFSSLSASKPCPSSSYCIVGPPCTSKRTLAMLCAAEFCKASSMSGNGNAFGAISPVRVAVVDAESHHDHRGIDHVRTVLAHFLSMTHEKMLVIIGCDMLTDDAQRALLSPMTNENVHVIATCTDVTKMQPPFMSRLVSVDSHSTTGSNPGRSFVRSVTRLSKSEAGAKILSRLSSSCGGSTAVVKQCVSEISKCEGLSFGQMVVAFSALVDISPEACRDELARLQQAACDQNFSAEAQSGRKIDFSQPADIEEFVQVLPLVLAALRASDEPLARRSALNRVDLLLTCPAIADMDTDYLLFTMQLLRAAIFPPPPSTTFAPRKPMPK